MSTRFLALILFPALCFPAVRSIELIERSGVLDAAPQGAAGPYERIVAKVSFAVDPKLPHNQIIADLDLAPRNQQGLVEFTADLYILKPRDQAKGNGTALVEISNRGGKGLLPTFDFATGSRDPRTQTDFGDRFLLREGFTLVWIGWEFDVPPGTGNMTFQAPTATDHGSPVFGMVRSEWIGDKPVETIPLGDRDQIGYPVGDPQASGTEMTVRDHIKSERTIIPREKWRFSDDRHATLEGGFEPGRIYEVIYRAKDPVIAGLGPAAVRDIVSYLKNGGPETPLSDQRKGLKRALGFGISQSGRFLRQFLYDGFNADEQGRIVFDGVWAHVAGAGRGSFNFRFAQPSRDGHPFTNVLYPVDVPPFTEDGLLERASQDHVKPKIFFTNGSYEYWGRAASLIHTTPDGKADVPPDSATRIYFFSGSQHGAGTMPPRKTAAQNLSGANDYRYAQRALLLAMQAWLADNKEPPPSAYPLIAKEQLATLTTWAFPKIPNLLTPHIKREAYRLDFSTEPPKVGEAYVSLVPQVNADGNEIAGIAMPEVRVPLASYTGWNLRTKAIGAPDEMVSFLGSYLPFPRTRVERENRHDPRASIEERYPSKRVYLERITEAAQKLVSEGFLLEADLPRIRDRAAAEWDYVLTLN